MEEGSYYAEVERYFVERRGSPLFISPSEWHLVFRWEQLGIPLQVVKEGIDRVFERPRTSRKPRKLGYCRQTVEAAFRRFREAAVGGGAPAAGGNESASLMTHLTELGQSLRTLAEEWSGDDETLSEALGSLAAKVEALRAEVEAEPDKRAGEIERELESADAGLLDAAEGAAGGSLVAELKRDAESSLASYRERMPEAIYRAALVSAYRRRLRGRLRLPTLSLYVR